MAGGAGSSALTARSHTVAEGESLSSIALSQYGDARLWFRIAQANALDVAPTAKLMAGQVLQVPAALAAGADAQGFRPYDPSAVIGDQTAALPAPAADNGGCGALGKIIMVVVAAVAAVATAGALAGASGSLGNLFTTGMQALGGGVGSAAGGGMALGLTGTGTSLGLAGFAVSGAVGSIASQVVGMGLGVQEGFSWKGVGMAALSSMFSGLFKGDLLGTTANTWPNAMVRAAVGNALTQTSAVVLGLQPKFDWRGVAASAVGAGVGHAVGDALGLRADTTGQNPGVLLAKRLATGLLAGTAAAVARGGKVAIQQVATDAFGQALADGFMDGLREPVRAGAGRCGPVRAATVTLMWVTSRNPPPPTYHPGNAIYRNDFGDSRLQYQQLPDDFMMRVLHGHRLNAEAVTLRHRAHFGRVVIGQHH